MRTPTVLLSITLGLAALALPAASRADCVPEGCIQCGKTYAGTTVGDSSHFGSYSCAPGALSGPDMFYCFSLNADTEVTLELVPAPQPYADLALLLLEGTCAPQSCTAAADEPGGHETLQFIGLKSKQYYVAIDGHLTGDDAPFDLKVTCKPYGVCDTKSPIQCGDTVTDDLGDAANFDLYLNAQSPKPGPEVIRPFSPAASGKATVKLHSSSLGMTDLIVLEDVCSPARVIAIGEDYWSSETVTFDVTAGKTYYLVVDSGNGEGAGDQFDLSVTCATGCSSDADCAAPLPACNPGTTTCVQCTQDGHCAKGELCSAANLCQAPPPECTSAAECGAGQYCDNAAGTCVARCDHAGANACKAGDMCDATTGLCLAQPPKCTGAGECAAGQYCDPATGCVSDCNHAGANPCGSGYFCDPQHAGLCEPVATGPDASGADSGPAPDAAVNADLGAGDVAVVHPDTATVPADIPPDAPAATDTTGEADAAGTGDSSSAADDPGDVDPESGTGAGPSSGCSTGASGGPVPPWLLLALLAFRAAGRRLSRARRPS